MQSLLAILGILVVIYLALSLLPLLAAWAEPRKGEDIEDRSGWQEVNWYDPRKTQP